MKKLAALLSISDLSLPDITIQGLSLDSRLVKQGDLFFAYPGKQVDGRFYIQDAIEQGAVAVIQESEDQQCRLQWNNAIPIISIPQLSHQVSLIADRFYDAPSKKMTMIAVTGTNGKTSCCHLLAEAITLLSNKPVGVLGTVGNGLFGQLKQSDLTTADAITIQKTLNTFVQQDVDTVVMEASSHALEQRRVAAIDFDIGIYTNLTHDHLDYHGDIEHYAAAKHRLFEMPSLRYGILNLDDPFGMQWGQEMKSQTKVMGYSCDTKHLSEKFPVLIADHIILHTDGIAAHLKSSTEEGALKSQLLGRFNISNLLAVISALLALNYSLSEILAIIPKLHTVPGRMQTLRATNQPAVVIDFAHTPDALEQALKTLKEHCAGKLYCIFGCGGDRDRTKRPEMARIAEQLSDKPVITNDNPRTEDYRIIFNDMIQGLENPQNAHFEQDRAKAIQWALEMATPEDIVLIAGKGHEPYQIIGYEKLPFSDFEVVEHFFHSAGNKSRQ